MKIGKVLPAEITQEMRKNYLDYAMSVIVARALPDVRDGLKPVHRRILYAMHDMGLRPTSAYTKSAKVVGEAMGKYHPHGDGPIYDAIVRLAQDFSMRYTLVDGQGNFGCFTKDTKVKLTDGRDLSFGELINEHKQGKKNYTYTVNNSGMISIAEIKEPRLTIRDAEVIKITLDNGEVIKCTPNHLFMLKDRSYKEAQNLMKTDSLMPHYQRLSQTTDRLNREGYVLIFQSKTKTWVPVHHLADNYNLTHGVYKKSAGRVRHHVNFDKRDNNPENIIRIAWGKHWELHYQNAHIKHQDPEYREKLAKGRADYWANPIARQKQASRMTNRNLKNWQDPEYKQNMRKILSEVNIQYIKEHPEKRQEYSEREQRTLKRLWQDPEYRAFMHEKIIKGNKNHTANNTGRLKFLNICKEVVKKFSTLNEEHYNKLRNEIYPYGSAPYWTTGLKNYFSDNPDMVRLEINGNHKVINIENLATREDVYDLTIDNYHNFALAAGVFVHNSVDGDPPAAMRYCITGDALVITNGGLKQIRELSDNNLEDINTQVVSLNKSINTASKWFNCGKHQTIKLTTRHGFCLQGTYNHPVLTWKQDPRTGKPGYEWKLLDQVAIGDVVIIDRTPDVLWPAKPISLEKFTPTNSNYRTKKRELPKTLNKKLAFLIGSLVAEGTLSTKKFEFCNSDRKWIRLFEQYWKDLFPDSNLHRFERKPYVRLEMHCLYTLEFLKNLGLAPSKSPSRQIPHTILQSSKAVVASFLQAYFEGDGSISSSKKMVELSAISKSERLIQELQITLLRFGIASTKRFDKYRNIHKLYLRGLKNYKLFSKYIGFFSRQKRQKLAAVIDNLWKDSSLMDSVPYLREYVLNNIDLSLKYDQRVYAEKHNFNTYSNLASNQERISRLTTPILKEEVKRLFTDLLENNYLFDRVTSVEDGGIQQVYSIRVDSTCHSFVANGFINHNTEVRPAKISEELLRDIEKETVEFEPNFDSTLREPKYLPSLLPNLLLMGAEGIAVGMATKIPPHNMTEVVDAAIATIEKGKATEVTQAASGTAIQADGEAKRMESAEFVIKKIDLAVAAGKAGNLDQAEIKAPEMDFNSDITIEDLTGYIKGPDFPTGGVIYGGKYLPEVYGSGRGRIIVRGVAKIEDTGKKSRIVITELPYQVNKASLVIKIAELARDKKVVGISDLRDESDRKGMSVVIELKKDARPKAVLNNLYKHTDLQTSFPANFVALVNGIPKTLNLKQILVEYVRHRQKVVTKRSLFDLTEAKRRAHILEGLKIALDNLDAVIKTIRESKDTDTARISLMDRFGLTEIQANAILDMQLRRLSALEREKIEEEYKKVGEFIDYLTDLITHPEKILAVIKSELVSLKEKYGDGRKTKIIASPVGEISEEDLVAQEEVIVTITRTGYIKRVPPGTYRAQRRGGVGVVGMTTKEEDEIAHILSATTHDSLMFFTNKGRVFGVRVWEIPEGSRQSKGQAIVNLINIDQGEQVEAVLTLPKSNEAKYMILATRKGVVKRTALEEFKNLRASGLIAIRLDKDDDLVWARPTDGKGHIILVTQKGKCIRFPENDARPLGRPTRGVRGITLNGSDEVIGMEAVPEKLPVISDKRKKIFRDILVVMARGLGKRTPIQFFPLQKRGGMGVKVAELTDKTGDASCARLVTEDIEQIIITSRSGQVIKLPLKNIPQLGRATQGVILMRFGKDKTDRVAAVAALPKDDESGVEENTPEVEIPTDAD